MISGLPCKWDVILTYSKLNNHNHYGRLPEKGSILCHLGLRKMLALASIFRLTPPQESWRHSRQIVLSGALPLMAFLSGAPPLTYPAAFPPFRIFSLCSKIPGPAGRLQPTSSLRSIHQGARDLPKNCYLYMIKYDEDEKDTFGGSGGAGDGGRLQEYKQLKQCKQSKFYDNG